MKHSSFCGAPDIPRVATLPREVRANVFSFSILSISVVLKSNNCCYEIGFEMFSKRFQWASSASVEAALTDCTAITTSAESLSTNIWLGNCLTQPRLLYILIYRSDSSREKQFKYLLSFYVNRKILLHVHLTSIFSSYGEN